MMKVLAGIPAIRHSSLSGPLIPGGRVSQGVVKVPTGGKVDKPNPRSPSSLGIALGKKDPQIFGVNPKPT